MSDDSGDREKSVVRDELAEEQRPGLTGRATQVLGVAPAVGGLTLGALYTLGAVIVAGEIRHEKLPLRDALPLIPVAQMLGRGMSIVLDSPVTFLAMVGWLVA